MCVFLPHMQLLGVLLNQRGKKEQMWPAHSGREKKELIGSCREAERDLELVELESGIGAGEKREGDDLQEEKQREHEDRPEISLVFFLLSCVTL